MENNEQEKEVILKNGFFKKFWWSILKIEKYPNMAAEGFGRALAYLAKIVLILAIVLCLGLIYQTYGIVQEGIKYLQNEFPEFSYKDGILSVESEDVTRISSEDSYVGKVIIDTKTDSKEEKDKYVEEVENSGGGLVVLKDKVVVKNRQIAGDIEYKYEEVAKGFNLSEFNKQDVINYANSSQMFNLYLSLFLTLLVYAFVMYFITTLSNAILLSAFGYITTLIARIKMRYVAILNMSMYALTLSVILNSIYIAINTFIAFNMEYFSVMYAGVAAIYLVAAILILKSEFIKKQQELIKIAEEKELLKKEENKEEQDRNKEEGKEQEKDKKQEKKKEEKEKDKERKETKKQEQGGEPEGSNA